MKGKTTAVFAALLAAAAIAYFLYRPAGIAPKTEERLLLAGLRPDEVIRFEISRPGGPDVALEKVSVAPASWRVLPLDRPAEPAVVQGMLGGIGRLSRTGSMEPGRPETDPGFTGLGAPRLSVTFVGEGRRETVRFGNPPPTNQSAVFVQREGDARICLAEADVFEAYNKTAAQARSRRLAHFDPHRVVRLEIEDRYLRPMGKGELATEYEKSVIERSDKPPDRGWYLRKPWEERLEDMRVNLFLSDLSGLLGEEFQPPGDWKAKGLDVPQFIATIAPHGAEKPVVVQFGGRAEGAGRKECLYAHVVDSNEVALVDRDRFERLPRHRKQFRSDAIFPFPAEEAKAISLEVAGLGKAVLEQREVRTKTGDEELVSSVWDVLEPKAEDLKSERDRVERFVAHLFVYRIADFLGEQPDPKLFSLDPPEVILTVRAKDGRAQVLHLGMKGEGPGYMRREGRGEIFQVKPEMVKFLRRLELNFRTLEMYNVPREALREFRFEWKGGAGLEPLYYIVRRDPADRTWKFADKGHEGDEADPDRVDGLLAAMNYIKADAFVTREPGAAARHRLQDREAAGTLWIFAEGGPPGGAVLYVSKDLSDRPTHPLYRGRFEGSPVIFELNPMFVESLKRAPIRKKE